jgi:RHS repeat-associated protein
MFAWDGRHIREERDTNGVVTKRFFAQGVQLVTGTNAGLYYYTRDHLGSIRELTDVGGNIRARYAYDPFGRKTRLSGDLDADFGFGGMLWATEANLYVTHFRAYDPNLGRWLSRDPLRGAEARQGPNLYAYVGNEPVSRSDPSGLAPTLPGGLNSVTIGLAAAAATDPGGVQTFLVEVGEAAGPALEALAPTLQAGAPALEAQAPAVVNCVQTAAGYAGGPLPEQVVEFADAVLPEVAQAAQTTDAEVYQAATDWIESTLRATADWRTSLPFDEQVEAYNSIWSASEILFGERWWWWRANLW